MGMLHNNSFPLETSKHSLSNQIDLNLITPRQVYYPCRIIYTDDFIIIYLLNKKKGYYLKYPPCQDYYNVKTKYHKIKKVILQQGFFKQITKFKGNITDYHWVGDRWNYFSKPNTTIDPSNIIGIYLPNNIYRYLIKYPIPQEIKHSLDMATNINKNK